MSISSELAHVLGIVRGLFIKGQSTQIVNITHAVEQSVADAFGPAAVAMAKQLASNTTMKGRDKQFAIGDAIVATAVQNGFKGDLATLKTAGLKVALTAYQAAEPNFGADIKALAMHLSANPFVGVVAELVGAEVQSLADHATGAFAPALTTEAAPSGALLPAVA